MTLSQSLNFETELNEIIMEYFDYCKFTNAKLSFLNELKEKGISFPNLSNTVSFVESKDLQDKLFQAFHQGNKVEFFDLWDGKLSAKLRMEDSVCQKLEFYCQVYFAIYPLLQPQNKPDSNEAISAMAGFREFLESGARSVSNAMNQEFIQYYALPFVNNPRDHPSFCELFHTNWISGLEARLKRFFPLAFGTENEEPALLNVYKSFKKINTDNQDEKSNVKILQAKNVDLERRANQYSRKLNQVQINFHSLLGITAELIDLLEGSIQGVPISADHLKNICQKIFVSQQNPNSKSNGITSVLNDNSIDLSRPGTASRMLLQSMQMSHSSLIDTNRKLVIDPVLSDNSTKTPPLNFTKLKFDLRHGTLRIKLLLLQAFRWRITKTNVETRNKFIDSISQHDLLGIEPGEYHDSIFRMMNSSSGSVELQEYFARFINAIATLCRGRSYLVRTSSVCELLFLNIINITHQESIFRESLIGALQKLSLRRYIQTYMISNGMIEWLLTLLEENSQISEYTLDYSVALLMNLCLRTSGKKRCLEEKVKIIRVLSKMLNSCNKEIASYVNGAFYSILGMPEIREEARKMNLEETLRNHMKPDHPHMNRQFEYIINQLKSNDEPKLDESDDEEEDDDEEDPEILEGELDKDECMLLSEEELTGENLLNTNYSLSSNYQRANSDLDSVMSPTINRPITPGTFLGKRASINNESDSKVSPTRTESSSGLVQDEMKEKQKIPVTKPNFIKDNPNYKQAFSSRPKIPRTPDEDQMKRGSAMEGMTGPIQSSGRLPTPSNSNNHRRGRETMSTVK